MIEETLQKLGLTLPNAAAPAANYVPSVQHGSLLFISGQLPLLDGRLFATGKLGAEVDLETGQQAARHCALNILAQLNRAIDGDWSKFDRIIKLTSFVNSTPEFADHHLVTNGCSDLLGEVLGDAGRHSRSAVGMGNLPLNAAVEIEAIVGLK
ncbi:MAG: RidA family protein [Alphaproteobacteria bacterium]|nr:RidA family protein [Alphaproteobacteria bacterium SS10]